MPAGAEGLLSSIFACVRVCRWVQYGLAWLIGSYNEYRGSWSSVLHTSPVLNEVARVINRLKRQHRTLETYRKHACMTV
jgi:hypothetical protein